VGGCGERVGAGAVADGVWPGVEMVAGAVVWLDGRSVWLGDGLADLDGLAVREGLGDRDGDRDGVGVNTGVGVTIGTEFVGVDAGLTAGWYVWAASGTGRTQM
jgi:hypothetical protein